MRVVPISNFQIATAVSILDGSNVIAARGFEIFLAKEADEYSWRKLEGRGYDTRNIYGFHVIKIRQDNCFVLCFGIYHITALDVDLKSGSVASSESFDVPVYRLGRILSAIQRDEFTTLLIHSHGQVSRLCTSSLSPFQSSFDSLLLEAPPVESNFYCASVVEASDGNLLWLGGTAFGSVYLWSDSFSVKIRPHLGAIYSVKLITHNGRTFIITTGDDRSCWCGEIDLSVNPPSIKSLLRSPLIGGRVWDVCAIGQDQQLLISLVGEDPRVMSFAIELSYHGELIRPTNGCVRIPWHCQYLVHVEYSRPGGTSYRRVALSSALIVTCSDQGSIVISRNRRGGPAERVRMQTAVNLGDMHSILWIDESTIACGPISGGLFIHHAGTSSHEDSTLQIREAAGKHIMKMCLLKEGILAWSRDNTIFVLSSSFDVIKRVVVDGTPSALSTISGATSGRLLHVLMCGDDHIVYLRMHLDHEGEVFSRGIEAGCEVEGSKVPHPNAWKSKGNSKKKSRFTFNTCGIVDGDVVGLFGGEGGHLAMVVGIGEDFKRRDVFIGKNRRLTSICPLDSVTWRVQGFDGSDTTVHYSEGVFTYHPSSNVSHTLGVPHLMQSSRGPQQYYIQGCKLFSDNGTTLVDGLLTRRPWNIIHTNDNVTRIAGMIRDDGGRAILGVFDISIDGPYDNPTVCGSGHTREVNAVKIVSINNGLHLLSVGEGGKVCIRASDSETHQSIQLKDVAIKCLDIHGTIALIGGGRLSLAVADITPQGKLKLRGQCQSLNETARRYAIRSQNTVYNNFTSSDARILCLKIILGDENRVLAVCSSSDGYLILAQHAKDCNGRYQFSIIDAKPLIRVSIALSITIVTSSSGFIGTNNGFVLPFTIHGMDTVVIMENSRLSVHGGRGVNGIVMTPRGLLSVGDDGGIVLSALYNKEMTVLTEIRCSDNSLRSVDYATTSLDAGIIVTSGWDNVVHCFKLTGNRIEDIGVYAHGVADLTSIAVHYDSHEMLVAQSGTASGLGLQKVINLQEALQ
eukprot:GHVH01011528.1.p1 GENE.GHVH01011528.1~~GHVH01011528.1.p1  ORF type:complete len:1024 (+),score=122.88 GHVH01011528.1:2356-5427(+)